MRATLDASGYFSLERMRRRDPVAFEALVGVRAHERARESDDEGEAMSGAERILNRALARERRERTGVGTVGAGGRETGEAATTRFGSAFAGSSATRALGRDAGDGKVSDEVWRRAMFDGWGGDRGEGEGSEGGGESTSGGGDESAVRERAASTYVIDADEYRSSGGQSSKYISQSEYSARVAEFERTMRERFLDGGDDDFDYSRVDADDALDAHWRREMDQDAEDAYFDRD